MPTSGAKQKIAILGGGIAALATAFELTEAQDWQDKYDITVYQMGWRLGGKCATGRGPNGRIEEHGIHAFSGSYYNALGVMWRAYKAQENLKEPGVLASFGKAFRAGNAVVMWELLGTKLLSWPFYLSPNKMYPDDYERSIKDVEAIIKEAEEWYARRYRALEARKARKTGGASKPESIGDYIRRNLDGAAQVLRLLGLLWRTGMIASLTNTMLKWIFVRPTNGWWLDKFRRIAILFNYGATIYRGLFDLDKNILENGLDVIDDQNFDEWLQNNGATLETMKSPLVYNTVDLSYNYPFGDTSHAPRMAAGTYLRWTLRMYLNMQAFAWSFEAGTGETVIAPLYHVLKHRGVRFEFFHKVRELKPSADGKRIEQVLIDVQATPKEAEYDPLVWIKALRCWPNKPKYDLLKEGVELEANDADLESYWSRWKGVGEKTLQAGQDFDKLVFGISIGAMRYLCGNLMKLDPRWQSMSDNIPTCATQTMQVWLNRTTTDLGADVLTQSLGIKSEPIISGTFVDPFNGQVDFSHLIQYEDWPEGEHHPLSLWYFSGSMALYEEQYDFQDHVFPQSQHVRVKFQSIQFLQATAGYLWPNAMVDWNPLGLNFRDLRADPHTTLGVARFESQFWRANIDPTERYVLAPPHSTAARLEAGDSGFSNLVLAGDWIYNNLNVGSVEGAVMGGRLASNAICGSPALDQIIGYKPPRKPRHRAAQHLASPQAASSSELA